MWKLLTVATETIQQGAFDNQLDSNQGHYERRWFILPEIVGLTHHIWLRPWKIDQIDLRMFHIFAELSSLHDKWAQNAGFCDNTAFSAAR